jgi:hypothetical protein
MRWSDLPWKPSSGSLRGFALLWLLWFTTLAGVSWSIDQNLPVAAALAALALAIGVPGVVTPRVIRPVFVAAMVLSFPMGWLTSRLLLGLTFYCLLTPLGLVFRLIGRDPLHLRKDPRVRSYWMPREDASDLKTYFYQS